MNKMLLVMAGLIIALAVACGSSATATTVPPGPTATEVPPDPTATSVPQVPTSTPMVSQEWALQEIAVDGSTVTVTLQVYAGIDMDVTVGGVAPSRVDSSIPELEFIFENVAAGDHLVVISDVVGFSERAFVTVAATGPGDPQNSDWLAEWLFELDSGKVEFEPLSITKYQHEGQIVYYIVPHCCDQFSDLLDAGGNLIGHPDGGITGQGDGTTKFSPTGLEGEIVWQQR